MIKQMYRIHSIYNNMLNNNTKKTPFCTKKLFLKIRFYLLFINQNMHGIFERSGK